MEEKGRMLLDRRKFIKHVLWGGAAFFLAQSFNNPIEAAAQYCNPQAPARRRDITGRARHRLPEQMSKPPAPKQVQPWKVKVIAPPVKETNLKFVQTLEKRKETDFVVIHHIGNTNRDVSAAEVHQWHLANGWAGIGYHYLIRKNGTIERGRPLEMVGAHCYGHNQNSIGINIVGDFEVAVPTVMQMAAAEQLTAYLCQLYRISDKEKIIFGHRDLNDTLCPGRNLYAKLGSFRHNVFAELGD